jgi:hypothetical protein
LAKNLLWVAIGLTAIWLSVLLISLLAPDLEYGTERESFPLVPSITWVWGAAASSFLLRAFVQRRGTPDDQRHAWIGLTASTVLIWAIVTITTLIIPLFFFEFGDNLFWVPLGSLVAPAAGAVATSIVGQYVPLLTDAAAVANGETEWG